MDYLPEEVSTVCKTDLEHFSQRKRVGSYLLGETIGEGSFAKVKIAIHVSTGEKVAIKIINKKKAREDRYVSRNLKREAQIMQLIRHRNVVRLLEVMETDSFYYLVTELCAGGELLDRICERKYFDEDTTRKYVQQLVSAVSTMHKIGVVHRDLKIENFLLDEDDNLKIVDFGLSNVLPPAALETWERIGMCPLLLTTHCGSPAYAAPELLAQESYGAQVDVWSIGVNMFAMLTGNLPYTMEPFSIIDLYHKMMERRMSAFPKRVSQGARDLIMQFLHPIPQKRITLQQAANHPWLKQSCQPSSSCLITTDNTTNEINQNIILHIAENMGMNMKELVTSVTENRASHSFAIYFLINERLRKFEERKSQSSKKDKQSFSKLKVIKKARLPTENISGPRSRFTYKGMKIATNSTSQPRLQDGRSRSSSTYQAHVNDSLERKETDGQWNQYATFPRDRRTANAKGSIDKGSIGSASFDRGSDDIDYHRVSSPETTDTSVSSLESSLTMHNKLTEIKGSGLSAQFVSNTRNTSSTGESGSEDEHYSRGRSKSLTNSEEYDDSRNLFSAYGRNRTSSMANCFHHNFIVTSPRNEQQHSRVPPRCISPISPRHSKTSRIRNENVHEALNSYQMETRTSSRIDNCLKSVEERENNNKENIAEKSDENFKKETLTLKKTSVIDNSFLSTPIKGCETAVLREILPPPTPFKDDSVAVSIEQLETRKISNEIIEKRLPLQVQRKEIVIEKNEKSKKTTKRKNQRKNHEKTKSLSDIKVDVVKPPNFHKIEVEKVRRIELVPLKNPTMHIAPTLHTISPFSLNCVKQESPFNPDTLSQQLKVTTEPESNLERAIDEPRKAQLMRTDSLKQAPFKVDFVKLAKWQRVPVLRAELVMNNNVKKCTTMPIRPLDNAGKSSKEQESKFAEGETSSNHSSIMKESMTSKGQIKVHRTRSCSGVDYTQAMEKDNEISRNDKRRPRLKSRTSTGRITVRKGSSFRTGNVFIVRDTNGNENRYNQHQTSDNFDRNSPRLNNAKR